MEQKGRSLLDLDFQYECRPWKLGLVILVTFWVLYRRCQKSYLFQFKKKTAPWKHSPLVAFTCKVGINIFRVSNSCSEEPIGAECLHKVWGVAVFQALKLAPAATSQWHLLACLMSWWNNELVKTCKKNLKLGNTVFSIFGSNNKMKINFALMLAGNVFLFSISNRHCVCIVQ